MFKLSEAFIGEYRGKQPEWGFGDLSYVVFKRSYARHKDDGSQEEFWETCQRVVEGVFNIQLKHCDKMGLPWNGNKAQASAQKMFSKMWQMKFLPPGRGLWLMGAPVIDKIGSAGLNNCGYISTKEIHRDFSYPFCWAADMLMLGVGIGFDTKGAGKVTICKPSATESTFQVPDSREGWVDALRHLLDSYATPDQPTIRLDFSLVRGPGLPIKGFGGTSSGPEPLREGLEDIRELLHSAIGKPITSVQITDIMNLVGKFVVSGNVRRSAEIAIGEIEDQDFIQMKDYNLFPKELQHHRWASNNSVFVDIDDDFGKIVDKIKVNGEPGLIFLKNARHFGRIKDGWNDASSSKYDDVDGFNPCAEQGLRHGELCCLVETFPANHEDEEDYFETLKYAFLYAKTVTLVPTHSKLTNQVMLQNRRIGLSMSGIQQAIRKFNFGRFFADFCDKNYEQMRHWDRIYSRWLGIPTSIKVTTVKPSGSVSLLAGATPGVHCTHAPFYLRTIRMSALDPMVTKLMTAGYRVELDAKDIALAQKTKLNASATSLLVTPEVLAEAGMADEFKKFGELGGSVVVYFPVKEKNFTKSKFEISLWEQLCLARELQDKWSDNSVSITVTFRPEETKELKGAIEYMASYVKTLSFLPLEEHGYAQAPYQNCTEAEYIEYSESLKRLRLASLKGKAKGEKFCNNDICVLE
jgi:ribonucleoside-triphosphate reductase